ncbi:MAG: type II toxin-antitoxin system RelE/ParE family toxin [Candidatus Omnitrophota bacterium]|nr:type II toxin-antitoxin system RelE/ParE family toxin [Candidatus Omnitrophota bacterium]
MYNLEFSRLAGRELEKIYRIDKQLYFRFIAAVEGLKTNPFLGKYLKGRLAGNYSLRVGNYRVIYSIYKNRLLIYIIDLGHRREVYR